MASKGFSLFFVNKNLERKQITREGGGLERF